MCQYNSEPVHEAENDIICYKVLRKSQAPRDKIIGENVKLKKVYVSPYFKSPNYEAGGTYTDQSTIEKGLVDRGFGGGRELIIHGGLFHFVQSEEDADNLIHFMREIWDYGYEYGIAKCLIPAGTLISKGTFTDFCDPSSVCCESICAKTFKILEIVEY